MDKYLDNKILFEICCIEGLADYYKKTGKEVFDAIANKTNFLKDYILGNYEALHSQSEKYIVDDLVNAMDAYGVVL